MSRHESAVLVAPKTFQLEPRTAIDLPVGWVVVRVREVGICGSDLRVYSGQSPQWPFPVVLGHEAWGVVSQRGDGTLPVGTRVAINPLVTCGRCDGCARGAASLCAELSVVGGDLRGALGAEVAVPAVNGVPLDAGVSDDHAVLTEPLAAAVHAVRRAQVSGGEVVVVIGLGAIGLLTALAARAAGAGHVIAIGHRVGRQELARNCGLDAVYGTVEQARDLDERLAVGVDVAFACAGGAVPARDAIALTRYGGRAVLCGSEAGEHIVAGDALYRGNRSVIGSAMYDRVDFERAVTLLGAGLLPPTVDRSTLCTSFPLERITEAFAATAAGVLTTLKAVVTVGVAD